MSLRQEVQQLLEKLPQNEAISGILKHISQFNQKELLTIKNLLTNGHDGKAAKFVIENLKSSILSVKRIPREMRQLRRGLLEKQKRKQENPETILAEIDQLS